jgi:hypothetical protein
MPAYLYGIGAYRGALPSIPRRCLYILYRAGIRIHFRRRSVRLPSNEQRTPAQGQLLPDSQRTISASLNNHLLLMNLASRRLPCRGSPLSGNQAALLRAQLGEVREVGLREQKHAHEAKDRHRHHVKGDRPGGPSRGQELGSDYWSQGAAQYPPRL